ncbi:MAG: YicC family protein [Syntrophaceae bacterium]|nr:YicC family protein [Syntrophaceae bacterium]
MLKSMTGYGRAEGETSLGRVAVETRSMNHRYCDINVKVPRRFAPFESRIRDLIRSDVSRGRIDVSLKVDSGEGEKLQFEVDLPLAKQYYQALQSLKKSFKLRDPITLTLLMGAKDLITAKEEAGDIEPYWHEIMPILRRSAQEMDQMKRSEGEALARDLHHRLKKIAQRVADIKHLFPLRLQSYQNRLHERIRSLLNGVEVDAARFQQEVAFLAERSDITEEIVRVESHLAQFGLLLKGEEPVGRKMDFLIQEIHREVNTISAKANDAEISQGVVEIKSELEKIREQVQNIE